MGGVQQHVFKASDSRKSWEVHFAIIFWWPHAHMVSLVSSVLHIPPLHPGTQWCGRTFCSWWCGERQGVQLLPLQQYLRRINDQHQHLKLIISLTFSIRCMTLMLLLYIQEKYLGQYSQLFIHNNCGVTKDKKMCHWCTSLQLSTKNSGASFCMCTWVEWFTSCC